jgi:hypothetical protein
MAAPLLAQERLWSSTIASSESDAASAVIPDGAGGIIVAGSTTGDLGGPSSGLSDIWLARFDRLGTPVWFRQLGTAADDYAYALAPDGAGGFFAAGATSGSLAAPNAGGADLWLGRFDAVGNQLWIAQYGTSGDDAIVGLAPDGVGGVFAAQSATVAHYDASGTRLWSSAHFPTFGIAPDDAGGCFVGGSGGDFAAAGHYSGAGSVMWVNTYHYGTPNNRPYALAVLADGAGGLFAAGEGCYSTGGSCSSWLAHFDSAGDPDLGTSWQDLGLRALAPDGSGGCFAGGPFLARIGPDLAQVWSAPISGITGLAPDGRAGVFAVGAIGNHAFAVHYGTCYANCDNSTTPPALNVLDFSCFLNAFAGGAPYANCDGSTTAPTLNILDFTCFLNRFAAGCS